MPAPRAAHSKPRTATTMHAGLDRAPPSKHEARARRGAGAIKPAAEITMKPASELIVSQASAAIKTNAPVTAITPIHSSAAVARNARRSQRHAPAEISRDHQASSKATPGSAGAK